jgi:hypothetical protein
MPDGVRGLASLVLILGFILVVFVIGKVAVFIKLVFVILLVVFFVFFLVEVIGNGIQCHWVRLRNFQFGFALGAAQDFSLFHFVFVHIDFSGTFRAAEHVSILRFDFQPAQLAIQDPPTGVLSIYPAKEASVEAHSPAIQCNSTPSTKE